MLTLINTNRMIPAIGPLGLDYVAGAAKQAGLDVRIDGNARIMHHKVIIIDRQKVIFGSFNFSDSANDKNDENIIIIDDPTFAEFFVEEVDAVWAEAKTD